MEDENWQDHRDEIIDDTLEELRDQRDEAQDVDLFGHETFNPQVFTTGTHLVLGPIRFETAFQGMPAITFGEQQGGINTLDVPAGQVATNYRPFLVHPYIYSLRESNGAVDGYYLGLYAYELFNENLHVAGAHTIHWKARGKASVYPDDRTEDSWTADYDQNEAEYLEEDPDMGEYFADELEVQDYEEE